MTADREDDSAIEPELAQYRRLLDNIPAEIGVFDPAGRFLFNTPSGIRDPAMRRWVIGRTHHDYCRERGYPTALADQRQAVIEQCVASRRAVTFEEPWTDKAGQTRIYARTFSPVLDPDGNVTHVIGYGHQITELKRAERELSHAVAELSRLKDQLRAENVYLREEIDTGYDGAGIVGQSPAIKNVLRAVATVAPTDAYVVISGETGTGKELVARAIHRASLRRDKPLIKVNCAAIPRELFESELFGHVKGAFTGALEDRAGRFRLADRGTLFLDEVGEIPLPLQSKLLRVLAEGCYEPVGEERTRQVDVRIIAASNRDLAAEVDRGRFRRDLYYRLNVFPVRLPPLRQRREDIPLLARRFLAQAARRLGRPAPRLARHHLRMLQRYDWPGNVRELQNVLERAAITARGGPLVFDLPAAEPSPPEPRDATGSADASPADVRTEREMRRRERDNIALALRRTNGRVYGPAGAAALLGINPSTLASRMRKLGLKKTRRT